MEEKNAVADLEFIKKIIEDSKTKISDNGIGFIVWGVIILLGLLSSYFSIKLRIRIPYSLNWVLLISFGWIFSIAEGYVNRKKNNAKTFVGKLLGYLWFSAGISMTIIGFVGTFSGAFNGVFISAFISVILGMAYTVSGILIDKKWISSISIGWWIGAIIIFVYPGLYTLLLMSAMITLFQIIPGIILYLEHKKELITE